jgi:hypothetical protein
MRSPMQLNLLGTCLHMHFSLNRRGRVLFTCLIAGLQICLAAPGWTEEVHFGCEYHEETTHEASTSDSGPEKRSNHGKARYTIDWHSKRVQGFSGEYELKFSDAELRIQKKTQNLPGERLNKASESIIINKDTGEYFLSEKLEGESVKGRYWYTYKTRKGTCKKIDEPLF